MMRTKIYQAVRLKRTFGLLFTAAALLSAGCTDEDIAGEGWHSRPKDEAIEFKDSSVLEILLQNGVDTNGDGAISYEEAAAVKSVEKWFYESAIESFDEFEYFTGVTEIGDNAFGACRSLANITIPDSVTSIGFAAFQECSGLTRFVIPDSITGIGVQAFDGCSSLTNITISDSVTEIGNYAFSDCGSLTSVYCKPTTPPALGNDSVFDDIPYSVIIYVPTASVEAYKSAAGWSRYADMIVGYDF